MAGADQALTFLLKEECAGWEGSQDEAGWAAELDPPGP